MKRLLALLLSLGFCAEASATTVFYPNTIAKYGFDGNLLEATGTYSSAVQTGTVGYVSNPTPPSGSAQWLSSTSTSNWLQAPSGLNSNMQSLGTWAFVVDMFYDGGVGNQSIFTINPAGTYLMGFQDTGAIYMYTGGGALMTAGGVITANANHQIVFSCSGGTNRYIWVDGVQVATDSSACTTPSSITNFYLAGYVGGIAGLNHTYSGNYRLIHAAITSAGQFPIVDTVTGSSSVIQLSPYKDPKQERSPFVTPRWWMAIPKSWLRLLVPFWPEEAQAYAYNPLKLRDLVQTQAVIRQQLFMSSRLTATPSPAPTPRQSPTATSTPCGGCRATPSPTPSFTATSTPVIPTPTPATR